MDIEAAEVASASIRVTETFRSCFMVILPTDKVLIFQNTGCCLKVEMILMMLKS